MELQGTKNLFPLRHLSHAYSGYYLNEQGHVFSTRGNRHGRLIRLNGSRASAQYSRRYYALAGRSLSSEILLELAKADPNWEKETGNLNEDTYIDVVDHVEMLNKGLKAKGQVVATIENGKLVFGSIPKIHTTEKSVRDELTRLAVLKPGTKFVSLKITNIVVAGGITWE